MSDSASAKAFLAEPQVCVLATVNPDGSPHAMPMWYAYEDGVVWFMTQPGTQKCRNIERDGRATVVVDRRETPYYAVMVKGAATLGPGLDTELKRRIIGRYLDADETGKYLARESTANSTSIRFVPERFVEFSGRAGR